MELRSTACRLRYEGNACKDVKMPFDSRLWTVLDGARKGDTLGIEGLKEAGLIGGR